MLRRSQRLQDKLNRERKLTQQARPLEKIKITLRGDVYVPPPVIPRRLSSEEFRARFVRRKVDPLDIWVTDVMDRIPRDEDGRCLLTVECVKVRQCRVYTAVL